MTDTLYKRLAKDLSTPGCELWRLGFVHTDGTHGFLEFPIAKDDRSLLNYTIHYMYKNFEKPAWANKSKPVLNDLLSVYFATEPSTPEADEALETMRMVAAMVLY